MAINTYTCDTCNRNKQVVPNNVGLDVIHRCTITSGCIGKLFMSAVHEDSTRISVPPNVDGLANWTQRNVIYTHHQKWAASRWVINHNLNKTIILIVVDDNNETVNYTVINSTDHTTIIEFPVETAGTAQVHAPRSFIKTDTRNKTTTEINANTSTLLNPNKIVTFASKLTAPQLSINLVFTSPLGIIKTNTFIASRVVHNKSAWHDTNNVLISGRAAAVYSFELLSADLVARKIPIQSTVNFDTIDSNPITKLDCLILLSNSPHTHFDKVKNQYVDMANKNMTPDSIILISPSELSGNNNIISSVYPNIRNV